MTTTLPATVTPTTVTLDTASGTVTLPAYVDTAAPTWNGYVRPYLTVEAVATLADRLSHDDGEALVTRNGGAVTVLSPEYPGDPWTVMAQNTTDGTPVWHFDFAWTFTA